MANDFYNSLDNTVFGGKSNLPTYATDLLIIPPGALTGYVNVDSGLYTVSFGPGTTPPGVVQVTISVANGIATPSVITVPGSFRITPTAAGAVVVTISNDAGLNNPTSSTYTAITPIPAATNKYRFQQPLLHQRAHAEYETLKYTNHLGQEVVVPNVRQYFNAYYGENPPGNTTKAPWGCGSDWYSLCVKSLWKWEHDGGDWLGVDGPQGTVPWGSSPIIPTAQPAGEVEIDVTSLVQHCDSEETWYAFFLRIVGTAELTLIGPLHPTAPSSVLEIVRNGVTETHDLWYASVLTGPLAAQTTAQQSEMKMTATRPCPIEFHRPVDQSVPCTSAKIKLRYAGTAWGTNLSVKVYKTNPKIPDMATPVSGLAAAYPLDVGLWDNPAVCAGMWIRDDTVITDILDVDRTGDSDDPWVSNDTRRTINQEALYDPTLWGTPGVDSHLLSVPMPTISEMAQLLPHRNVNSKGTRAYGAAFQHPTYGDTFKIYTYADLLAEGRTPLAPGMGAVRLRYAEAGVLNGQMSYPGTTTGGPLRPGVDSNDLFMQFKRDKMGRVTDVYTRGYYMLGDGWDPNDDDFRYYAIVSSGTYPNTIGDYPEQHGINPQSAPWRIVDRSGKFPGGVQHITNSLPYPTYRRAKPNTSPIEWIYHTVGDTPVTKFTGGGGYSNTSGVFGYQGRWAFIQGFYKANHPGPACGGMVLNMEHYDFGNHNDCIPSQAYIKGWDGHWQSAPHIGGLGHLYPRKWYCVEHHWHMNTLAPYVEPPAGGQVLEAGFNVDGYDEWFVDGVFAGRTPLWAHRSSFMINWAFQLANGMPYDNNDTDNYNALRPITNVPPEEYMGAKEAILQTYYGGQSACPRNMDIFMNGFVVADSTYIGPMSGVSRENGGLGV